jgi:voltage-gated potassium channel
VVRIGDEMYESTARRIGADTVVIPEIVSGTEVVDAL